jgi:DNA repair protein RadC
MRKAKVKTGPEGHRKNLRSRFLKNKLDGFLEYEIVELLLTFCIPRRDVKPQAKILLEQFGSIRRILDGNPADLQSVDGVGATAALFLSFIREVAQIYFRQGVLSVADADDSFQKLQKFWISRLSSEPCECLEIAYLDGKFRIHPAGIERLETGDQNSVIMVPNLILSEVLRRDCAAVVLCHNHPDGSLLPSEHDERLTRIVKDCLEAVSLRLMDHYIVADGKIFSILRHRELRLSWKSNEA